VISIHPHEAALQHAKARQKGPRLAAGLPGISPGRGTQDQPLHPPALGRAKSPLPAERTASLTDIVTRAGAINLARLATLGLHPAAEGWASR